jgi:hypothetical protein
VSVVLLVLNALGAFAYIARTSRSWRIPQEQEQGLDSITGEPFIWAAAALPILAVFLLLNLTWGALILGYRQWRSVRLWLLLPALIWLAAIAVDFAHH